MPTTLPAADNIPAPTADELVLLRAQWDKYAPAKYRGLLEVENLSTLRDEKRKAKGRFVWDDLARRYISARTGRVLSRQEVREAFLEFSKAMAEK